jgi:hypothetical protein
MPQICRCRCSTCLVLRRLSYPEKTWKMPETPLVNESNVRAVFAVNALRPPPEQRCRLDKVATAIEFDNTLRLDVLQLVERPYFIQERLETDAMLVDGPQFHLAARECGCHLL